MLPKVLVTVPGAPRSGRASGEALHAARSRAPASPARCSGATARLKTWHLAHRLPIPHFPEQVTARLVMPRGKQKFPLGPPPPLLVPTSLPIPRSPSRSVSKDWGPFAWGLYGTATAQLGSSPEHPKPCSRAGVSQPGLPQGTRGAEAAWGQSTGLRPWASQQPHVGQA